MDSASARKRFTIIVALLAIAATALAAGSILPLFLGVRRLSREFIATRDKVGMSEQEARAAERGAGAVEEVEELASRITKKFLNLRDSRGVIDFLALVDTVVTDPQVALERQVGGYTPPQERIDVRVNAQGSFPNILATIDRFERFPFLSEVTGVSITRLESRTFTEEEEARGISAGDVRALFTLSVAVYDPKAAAVVAPTPAPLQQTGPSSNKKEP